MTTANPDDLSGGLPRDRGRPTALGWFAAVRHALDRPLTAYYLLLGASALLLTIGLIMVLSASSV
ncbi:MAG TPA: cell division protein FtsW, partial [Marmoricola sp.]